MPAESTVLAHDADIGADAFSFCLTRRAFAPHFHPAWTLGCVLSGRRRLTVQGRPHVVGVGDVVILRPGEVHACAPEGSAPFVWRGFHFRPECGVLPALRLLAAVRHAGPVFPAGPLLDEVLAAHALMGSNAAPALKHARLCTALGRLGAALARKKGAASAAARGRSAPRGVATPLEKLRTYLETHASERLNLEDMATMAHMDKFRLLRAFARLTGTTPYRYLESARVNRAQSLLRQGLPAGEAALEAGFSDQSHLTRAFRSRLGITPGACRGRP